MLLNSYLNSLKNKIQLNKIIQRLLTIETKEMSETAISASLNQGNESNEAVVVEKKLTRKEKKKQHSQERKDYLKKKREEFLANKSVGYQKTTLNETEYYFENGLRKVKPYMYLWKTTAKERWFNRSLIEIYATEFARVSKNEDLERLISSGKIRVNNQVKDKNYKVKNGDVLTHLKHRHEIGVVDDQIEIVMDTDELLAVNKPCSIPIHPCGKYRYNSLLVILSKEMNYHNIRNVYRIDRLTSGIVLFAKNFKLAKVLDQHIKNRTAEKTYICRVVGNFPDEEITVDQPLECLSRKAGLYWIDYNKGKESITRFKKLSYNGKSSVVYCYPKTGRTHQIRIHLQYLGHPIVNDPLYNDQIVWGVNNGKNAQYEGNPEEIELRFLNIHSRENWLLDGEVDDQPDQSNEPTKTDNTQVDEISGNDETNKRKLDNPNNEEETAIQVNKKAKIESETFENATNTIVEYDEDCSECKMTFRDPTRDQLIMYLHALKYKFGDMEFETKMPNWAKEDWTQD